MNLHELDPGFAGDDPRAELFTALLELHAHGPERESLRDAAVWASALFETDLVGAIAALTGSAALEALFVAAHDGFACECCGYHTLELPPMRDSSQVCVVCGWEDSSPLLFGVDYANEVDLDSAQRNYRATRASCAEWKSLVVEPTSRQARRREFLTFEDKRARLLDELEETFAGVSLDGGMTLEDAWAADGYTTSRPEYEYERTQAWTDVSIERVLSFGDWIFLNERGAFFHLAPLVRAVLTERQTTSDSGVCAIRSLFIHKKQDHGLWLRELASDGQLRFFARFLMLVTDSWLKHSPEWSLGYGDWDDEVVNALPHWQPLADW